MTEISIGKLLNARIITDYGDYIEYIEGNDTLENREIVIEKLFDQVEQDNYWSFTTTLIDNGNGVEVNMDEIHIPSDGSVSEWHLFEADMERQMLPKDVKKILRHEMWTQLDNYED